jgi:hypothetical protein
LFCLGPLNYRQFVCFLFGLYYFLSQDDLWQCTGKFVENGKKKNKKKTRVSIKGWIGRLIESSGLVQV